VRGRVLIIAGSDPSGGAGIQADIKTVTALGGYAMTAITALTVQDTRGVYDIMPVPLDIIREQIKVCIHDIGVDAIKIGMMGSADTASMISEILYEEAKDVAKILDPILVATSGDMLAGEGVTQVIVDELMPQSAILMTPNAPELAQLSGLSVHDSDSLLKAGEKLSKKCSCPMLLKGGHIEGSDVIDIVLNVGPVKTYKNKKIETTSTHGTGCTLSSAIATGCAQELSLHQSIERAIDYVRKAIETAPGFGDGHGPLNHGHTMAN